MKAGDAELGRRARAVAVGRIEHVDAGADRIEAALVVSVEMERAAAGVADRVHLVASARRVEEEDLDDGEARRSGRGGEGADVARGERLAAERAVDARRVVFCGGGRVGGG